MSRGSNEHGKSFELNCPSSSSSSSSSPHVLSYRRQWRVSTRNEGTDSPTVTTVLTILILLLLLLLPVVVILLALLQLGDRFEQNLMLFIVFFLGFVIFQRRYITRTTFTKLERRCVDSVKHSRVMLRFHFHSINHRSETTSCNYGRNVSSPVSEIDSSQSTIVLFSHNCPGLTVTAF